MELLFKLGVRSPVSYVYAQQIQPRFQGLLPGFGAGRKKAFSRPASKPGKRPLERGFNKSSVS